MPSDHPTEDAFQLPLFDDGIHADFDDQPVHQGLPVAGYQAQKDWAVSLVNDNKRLEEQVLRQIDFHKVGPHAQDIDQRAVALALTKVQEAFMWLNRAVFQPKRLEGEL